MPRPFSADLYALLPIEERAAIELDARPKDEANPLTRMKRGGGALDPGAGEIREHHQAHAARRAAEEQKSPMRAPPSLPDERSSEILSLLRDAYSARVAGDEFALRGNDLQASEFRDQERDLLQRAEAARSA